MGSHFLLQGDLPDSGIEPESPALAGGFFTTEPPGKPNCLLIRWENLSVSLGQQNRAVVTMSWVESSASVFLVWGKTDCIGAKRWPTPSEQRMSKSWPAEGARPPDLPIGHSATSPCFAPGSPLWVERWLPKHVEVLSPASVTVTWFANRVIADAISQVKMRSYRSRVGPLKPYDWCLDKKGGQCQRPDSHGAATTSSAVTGGDRRGAAAGREAKVSRATGTWSRAAVSKHPPLGSQWEPGPADLFRTSSLQSFEVVTFCCFSLPTPPSVALCWQPWETGGLSTQHILLVLLWYLLAFWSKRWMEFPQLMESCTYKHGFLHLPVLCPGSLLPHLLNPAAVSILPVLNPTPPWWHL